MATPAYDEFSQLSKVMLIDGFDILLDLEKSKGSYLYDRSRDTNYLDMASFFASMPIGMNNEAFSRPEVQKELLVAAKNKVSNSDFYTQQMIDFVETFTKFGMGDNYKYTFFIEGGALAVENALKTAFDWKVRKNLANGIEGEKGSQIMHFKQAFHGRSGYTLSLTNTSDPRKHMYFPKFDWPRIHNPKITFPINENIDSIIGSEENAYAEIEQAFENNPDDIAGIIIEPVQAEGGDNHFRDQFFGRLRKYADDYEALLIYDEVQTGMGLTGKVWYSDYLPSAKPDVFSFGKKSQVCGIVAGDRVDEVESNVFHESSRINSTWGGNIVDMVRSRIYMEVIEEQNLIGNADKMGSYLKQQLIELSEKYQISNVRGSGLMVAFDLEGTQIRDNLRKQLYKNEMVILPCGDNSIRFRPYLDVTKEELDLAMEILERSLSEMEL